MVRSQRICVRRDRKWRPFARRSAGEPAIYYSLHVYLRLVSISDTLAGYLNTHPPSRHGRSQKFSMEGVSSRRTVDAEIETPMGWARREGVSPSPPAEGF